MFPEDCIQSIVGAAKWWTTHTDKSVCRGALIRAYIPHIDQIPYAFTPTGRTSATEHGRANVTVEPIKVGQPMPPTPLPVAAMPTYEGEVWAAYRAKTRPCIVLGCGSLEIDGKLTHGMVKHSTAPTYIIAPYYGVARKGNRVGYNETFVKHIRHCAFPQFVWDILPYAGGEESILRLDQIQAIGAHTKAYQFSGYRLSDGALEIIDELLSWLIWQGLSEDSLITMYRRDIEELME